MRVGCGPQGRDGRVESLQVPFGYLARKGGKANTRPLVFQLLIAPAGPLLGACRQEHLEGGMREIPPCPYRGRRPPGRAARAKRRWRSSRAARTAGQAATREAPMPAAAVRISRRHVLRRPADPLLGLRSAPKSTSMAAAQPRRGPGYRRAQAQACCAGQRHQAVQRAAVEQVPAQRAPPPADRALAGAAGTVDGDDRSWPCGMQCRQSALDADASTRAPARRNPGKTSRHWPHPGSGSARGPSGWRSQRPWRCGDRRDCRPCRR